MLFPRVSPRALLLGLALTACGGRTTGDLSRSTTSDASTPNAPAPWVPSFDAGAPPLVRSLFPIPRGGLLGPLAFDATNVYAMIFSSPVANGSFCSWQSRWVRVAKDGSTAAELGDAATCTFYFNDNAVLVGDALYWIARDPTDGGGAAAVLMKMPTTGGAAERVRMYDRDFLGFGGDGASLFAVASGTLDAQYADGSVLRLALDGAPTILADQQREPEWIGAGGGQVVWATAEYCAGGNTCPTDLHRVPSGGGDVTTFAKRDGAMFTATLSDGAVFFYDQVSAVRRLSLDGAETSFVQVPWAGVGYVPIDRLRIAAGEVIAGSDSTDTDFLLAAPRAFDPPFFDDVVFEVDEGFVYAQRDGGLVRLPVP